MNDAQRVSREVIQDLLPVYLAGEASADTRSLVEAALARDPELEAMARAETPTLPPVPDARPDGELATIRRTRRLVRWRGLVMGLAIFVSLLPLSVEKRDDGVQWLILESPELAIAFVGAAVLLWLVYGAMTRRLSVTGV